MLRQLNTSPVAVLFPLRLAAGSHDRGLMIKVCDSACQVEQWLRGAGATPAPDKAGDKDDDGHEVRRPPLPGLFLSHEKFFDGNGCREHGISVGALGIGQRQQPPLCTLWHSAAAPEIKRKPRNMIGPRSRLSSRAC